MFTHCLLHCLLPPLLWFPLLFLLFCVFFYLIFSLCKVYLYVSNCFDELNKVDPIVNKCNALWCYPQLTFLFWVVLEMYCNSPNLLIKFINQSICTWYCRRGKYTHESLAAWKSLDAWSYFIAGFVGEIKVTRTPKDILVVCGHVCTF